VTASLLTCTVLTTFWIRTGLNAGPDPAIYLNAATDPASDRGFAII
jgi:hypothetical protein